MLWSRMASLKSCYCRLAVYEEEKQKAVDGFHWDDVRNVPENVGKAIQKAFRSIESANSDKLTGIFGDGTWTQTSGASGPLIKKPAGAF